MESTAQTDLKRPSTSFRNNKGYKEVECQLEQKKEKKKQQHIPTLPYDINSLPVRANL